MSEALFDLSIRHPAITVVFAAASGLLVGSFLNVCIVRWLANESVIRPRSRCPKCGNLIAWYDNIPVVSWLVLRGKCRHCELPIPVRYPLVELTVGVIWGFAFWLYGPTVEMLRLSMFATICLGIAVADAMQFEIPTEFAYGGLALGLLFAGLGGELSFASSFVGGFAALGVMFVFAELAVAALKREEAMGPGDVRMMGMLGAFLGGSGAALCVLLGAVLGLIGTLPSYLRTRSSVLPFGVYLAIAGVIVWFFGDSLIAWYTDTYLAPLTGGP